MLAKMSFDEILDLTADVFSFYNIFMHRFETGSRRQYTLLAPRYANTTNAHPQPKR